MVCYFPLQGHRSRFLSKNGKRKLVFKESEGLPFSKTVVSCGQCVGCRLARSSMWATRISHEASLYDSNCFVTLTFDDAHLPNPPSLDVRWFQLFMKRLRKHRVIEYYRLHLKKYLCRFKKSFLMRVANKRVPKTRFFHCGEYGDKYGRPHYHAILFNCDFNDKVFYKKSNGVPLYTSELLQKLWPYGFSTVGSVTFESAAYVARYSLKKVTGDAADKYYSFCPKTGEVFSRKPEYTTMSRRAGIGKVWFDKFFRDIYPSDEVIINGRKLRTPKYYDSQFEILYPSDFELLKQKRKIAALAHSSNNSPRRLADRLLFKKQQLSKLVRGLDYVS